ncbi:PD-(D/E)XK nuclease family protein [Caldimonas sp. KR1-144]|uniref:PD-(D/E)XK nuclease family protein n=1 Tax=Caldimonas sp. KR1-144 TaxID=3400911 RepID=UPI003C048B2A
MKSWSFSRLEVFEKCGWRAKLQFDDRAPIPPNPKGDRGTAIHDSAQDYVRGMRDDLIPECAHFKNELDALRPLFSKGDVLIEDEWGFDREWKHVGWHGEWRTTSTLPTGAILYTANDTESDFRDVSPRELAQRDGLQRWPTHLLFMGILYEWVPAWCRMKLDFMVWLSPTKVLVIDLKSGKKDGNEIKHTEQGQLYAVGVMLKYPEVEEVVVEFWYVDQNDTKPNKYSATQAARFLQNFTARGQKATSGVYQPRPSIFSCKWCPYRPEHQGGNGICEHATGAAPRRAAPSTSSNPLFFDFGKSK